MTLYLAEMVKDAESAYLHAIAIAVLILKTTLTSALMKKNLVSCVIIWEGCQLISSPG